MDMIPVSQHSVSPFDQIRQSQDGKEYWSARDLQELMGYQKWQNFEEALQKAMASCRNVGQDPDDHFTDASKLLNRGSRGGTQEVKDYQLSRYACYLVAMNSDPRKFAVAQAQTYFAIRTREAELKEQIAGQQQPPIALPPALFKDGKEAFDSPPLCPCPTQAELETAILSMVEIFQEEDVYGCSLNALLLHNDKIHAYVKTYGYRNIDRGLDKIEAVLNSMVKRRLLVFGDEDEHYYRLPLVSGQIEAPKKRRKA